MIERIEDHFSISKIRGGSFLVEPLTWQARDFVRVWHDQGTHDPEIEHFVLDPRLRYGFEALWDRNGYLSRNPPHLPRNYR